MVAEKKIASSMACLRQGGIEKKALSFTCVDMLHFVTIGGAWKKAKHFLVYLRKEQMRRNGGGAIVVLVRIVHMHLTHVGHVRCGAVCNIIFTANRLQGYKRCFYHPKVLRAGTPYSSPSSGFHLAFVSSSTTLGPLF